MNRETHYIPRAEYVCWGYRFNIYHHADGYRARAYTANPDMKTVTLGDDRCYIQHSDSGPGLHATSDLAMAHATRNADRKRGRVTNIAAMAELHPEHDYRRPCNGCGKPIEPRHTYCSIACLPTA